MMMSPNNALGGRTAGRLPRIHGPSLESLGEVCLGHYIRNGCCKYRERPGHQLTKSSSYVRPEPNLKYLAGKEKEETRHVPDTVQLGAILADSAFLTSRKINKLSYVFSISLNIPTPSASTILSPVFMLVLCESRKIVAPL
jgi:hypothetical protein